MEVEVRAVLYKKVRKQFMRYVSLSWSHPLLVDDIDFETVPRTSGVYVFSEFDGPLVPNPRPPSPHELSPLDILKWIKLSARILYVGKSTNLRRRLPGYRFRPYLQIQRKPNGSPPKHVADRHRARALIHAHQYFVYEGLERPLYLRWAIDRDPRTTETALIRELLPYLNTTELVIP